MEELFGKFIFRETFKIDMEYYADYINIRPFFLLTKSIKRLKYMIAIRDSHGCLKESRLQMVLK